MDVQLVRAGTRDAERLWEMQLESFAEMYRVYRDTETNPGAERRKAACPIPAPHKAKKARKKQLPRELLFHIAMFLQKLIRSGTCSSGLPS